jgi:RNA polymerase sigma-70 factor (ECF subfamily)
VTLALVLVLRAMDSDCSDAELVQHIAARGSDASQAEALLYRRFAGRIELYGRRHLVGPSAARDLVQQVLLLVLEAIRGRRLVNPAALASFVLGTCRNVSWDMRRTEQRQRRLEQGATEEVQEALDQRWLEQAQVVRLFGCMTGLPEREANVLRMSFWEDRPAEEIAQRIGASTVNVRVIRHRALARLAACLHADES